MAPVENIIYLDGLILSAEQCNGDNSLIARHCNDCLCEAEHLVEDDSRISSLKSYYSKSLTKNKI